MCDIWEVCMAWDVIYAWCVIWGYGFMMRPEVYVGVFLVGYVYGIVYMTYMYVSYMCLMCMCYVWCVVHIMCAVVLT